MSETPVEIKGGIHVERTVTINRAPEDVYRFWRNLENLPLFMRHLESVQSTGERRSHWVATAPLGTTVAWDAEIIDDQENRLIAWRSSSDTPVPNSGTVRFNPAPPGRGTEVRVALSYHPPAGAIGAAVAKLFGEEPDQQVEDDLRRLKQVLEAGEIATTDGQTSGRETASAGAGVASQQEPINAYGPEHGEPKAPYDEVEEAPEESFPASDAPAWPARP